MTAEVTDTIEFKGRLAVEFGLPGLAIFLRVAGKAVNPQIGDTVLIERSDGWMIQRQVVDVRDDNGPNGFFVAGLTKDDVPLASIVRWGTDASAAIADAVAAKAGSAVETQMA